MTHPLPLSPDHSDTPSRNALRKELRSRRRALSSAQQSLASERLALSLLNDPELFRTRHVAIYLANDGEIDPQCYITQGRKRGIQFYLPVLHPVHQGRLVFSPFNEDTVLTPNRFGIPEPGFKSALKRPPWALDAVLMPLVGFDTEGGRLGMGGGFYDRTFAFTRYAPRMAPKLIGLAHHCQQVEVLPVEIWDVPLHAIVSDRGKYRA
ncbi:5-formyltetrahydrofolate cyclo-ligase [Marinobacter changyiensis]|uniref:5-formyltetrahydrofolate cyclo-ligase n=1 Tax=Marinobacter changyiensis TaxID=2604091 RepID=UPI001264EA38|nr:5-formyltetrahydrofolate cyclo-ligase [Marinobacter changyiensis]